MVVPFLVDEWRRRAARLPALDKYFQPGTGSSYPVFACDAEHVALCYFFHTADRVGPNQLYLGAPFAYVVLDAADFSVLDEVTDHPFDLQPFEDTVYELSEVEKEANKIRVGYLKHWYNRIAELYPDQPSGEDGKQFWDMLRKVVPPPLWPYYEALSPSFAAWLLSEEH
jgi:hypothetical protein